MNATVMESHAGKLGKVTISAGTNVIVRFANGSFCNFRTRDHAKGFLRFYHMSVPAREENRGMPYLLNEGVWHLDPD